MSGNVRVKHFECNLHIQRRSSRNPTKSRVMLDKVDIVMNVIFDTIHFVCFRCFFVVLSNIGLIGGNTMVMGRDDSKD